MQWADDNPYFLLLVSIDQPDAHVIIDVGEQGWHTKHADWLRRPAEWYLCEKEDPQRAIVAQMVYEGDQPYYVKRHVGQMEIHTGRFRQVLVHGIGKKVPAVYAPGKTKRSKPTLVSGERTDRIWVLPHGVICGGEDVERLALAVVATMEWQTPEPEGEDAAALPSMVSE